MKSTKSKVESGGKKAPGAENSPTQAGEISYLPRHGAMLKTLETPLRSVAERMEIGKTMRANIPRPSHIGWMPSPERRDPIEILEESNRDRLPNLIPIRYGRMVRSPFTFFRGSAAVMASDLASTPATGIRVQACGDCHLLNFGAYATPERNLAFDLNDFDETLPAPWEWDLKRLVASFVVAGRDSGIPDKRAREAAVACACSYREHMHEFAMMSPMEVWYYRIDEKTLLEFAPDAEAKALRRKLIEKAHKRIGEYLFPKITERIGGRHRLVDNPPIFYHVDAEDFLERVLEGLAEYRRSLHDEIRVLFDRYRLEDIAVKVVGIGSVGTRCFVGLFMSEEGYPLLLQFKEAVPSVLAPYAGDSHYANQGQRVVVGQRLMQSASDIFLGWSHTRARKNFYVRQLRDMKMSLPVEGFTALTLERYAGLCGWTLARAHARSGDAATIAGYLGKGDKFDIALGDFAVAYADQTEQDHAALKKSVESGRIEALIEENL
jgi:uncharacterized protein (DUF2252 family)